MEGTRLGPYVIDRELGSGGMGTVYRATGPDGVVALKIVHDRLLVGGDATERFRREVQIGTTIRHPNVVSTVDGGEIDGRHFLAMEYVEGQTLAELLVELERVPEELCRHIGHEVSSGLAAIHAAGAVHRDVKPENVLITPDHVVKIMDLGVARSTDDALRLSQTGMFVGSLHYAAPEQFQGGGKGLDGRADLHALGLVLYELASGVNPYYADDVPQVVRRVLHEEPRKIGEIDPQLSAFFEEVVHCLLAKDRDQRFADADALCAVLREGEDSAWWHERAAALQRETARPIRRVRVSRETAVYGRDDEIAALRTLYERARSGDGNVVLVEGEAGIGKSRLVDELVGQLQRDGEELDFLFGSYPPGGAATAAGAFSTAYREQFGAAGSAPYLPENQVLAPAFDALLRGDPTPKDAEPLTKDSLQTCFVRATQTLAKERVVVVLIDDLHFAPEEGRSLFTSMAMGLPGHRVLLVGTTRPGLPEEWMSGLTRLDQTSQLALDRLGPKDLVRLLRDTLRSEQLARDLSAQIAEKSDGNPFFVFEILRGLREGQFITQAEDGSWASTKVIEDIEIPSSVLDLVNARVADLSEEERDLLDIACCWGFEFDPTLIGDVLGLGRIPVLKRFGQIERKHRLVRSVGRNYVFDHHQVQEALYQGLNEQLREEYHAALADALETRTGAAAADPETLDGAVCVDLCEHYLKGARCADAVRYLRAAQTHLSKGYLNAHLIALTEKALAVPDLLVGAGRIDALLRLARALDLLGRRERQEACTLEAVELAEELGDEVLRDRAAAALGMLYVRTHRNEDAEACYRRALERALARGDKERAAVHATGLGNICFRQSRFADAQRHHERAVALSAESGNPAGLHGVNLGNVFAVRGLYSEAREQFERALAISRDTGDRELEGVVTVSLALASERQGRLHEAQELRERGLAISREIGNRRTVAIALVNMGPVWHKLGDLPRARRAFEESVSLCRELGAKYPEGYGLVGLGLLADEEGDRAEALRLVEESIAVRRTIGHRDGVANSLLELGVLHDLADDADQARAALEEAVTIGRELGAKTIVAKALVALAALPGGDVAAALAAVGELGERADTIEIQWALYRATGEHAYVERARHLLEEWMARISVEHHEPMRRNYRMHREILAAWQDRDR